MDKKPAAYRQFNFLYPLHLFFPITLWVPGILQQHYRMQKADISLFQVDENSVLNPVLNKWAFVVSCLA